LHGYSADVAGKTHSDANHPLQLLAAKDWQGVGEVLQGTSVKRHLLKMNARKTTNQSLEQMIRCQLGTFELGLGKT
jgi:hypothetical protein